MREELTQVQHEIWQAFCRYVDREGRAPTVRELTRERGAKSISGTFAALRVLERKGYLCLTERTARGIEAAP